MRLYPTSLACCAFLLSLATMLHGQVATPRQHTPPQRPAPSTVALAPSVAALTPTADYTIGPDDQLSIVFFLNKDMSGDVIVRPDGKISLPLLNDIQASGLTPDQLRQQITSDAKRFMQEPNAAVVVRQINSRKVFILGAVEKPGAYSLTAPTTVLQLIATTGGLKEWADGRKIGIRRSFAGHHEVYTFNYNDVVSGKNSDQDIELKPGDIVIVP